MLKILVIYFCDGLKPEPVVLNLVYYLPARNNSLDLIHRCHKHS